MSKIITKYQFESELKPSLLRILKIIHVAQGFTIIPYIFVIFISLQLYSKSFINFNVTLLKVLTIINVTISLFSYSIANYIQTKMLKKVTPEFIEIQKEKCSDKQVSESELYFAQIFLAHQYKVMVWHLSVVFSMILLVLLIQSNIIFNQNIYWVNGISFILFPVYTMIYYPTKQKIISIFETKIGNN